MNKILRIGLITALIGWLVFSVVDHTMNPLKYTLPHLKLFGWLVFVSIIAASFIYEKKIHHNK